MKKKIRRRRCKHCYNLFKPDPRNLKKQKFCRKSECKEAGKRYSQQKWLMKPKNKGHFSGPANVCGSAVAALLFPQFPSLRSAVPQLSS